MRLEVQPVSRISGDLLVPPDKSLTHRAYLLGGIASGPSIVRNPLRGEDCESTRSCLTQLGVRFEERDAEVKVIPLEAWNEPSSGLDCGNSGTTMRLLSGLLASRPLKATLTGDHSLSRRPMKRIAEPLRLMGASVEGETPPLRITGTQLRGIEYRSPIASAQVKSCVLLAGLRAYGRTTVIEPARSRDHTERMLRAMGADLMVDGEAVSVTANGVLNPFEMTVPGDISSAAFWMVASAICDGSEVMLRGVNINETRSGILDVLSEVGVRIERENVSDQNGELVADLLVRPGDRRPFQVAGGLVPRLIDEIPVLAVLATQLNGTTVIQDAKELRVKETDRIAVVTDALNRMGAKVEAREDGMVITGPTPLSGTTVDASGDHRIGMAFAIAGLVAAGTTVIENAASIRTSYPEFTEHLRQVTQP